MRAQQEQIRHNETGEANLEYNAHETRTIKKRQEVARRPRHKLKTKTGINKHANTQHGKTKDETQRRTWEPVRKTEHRDTGEEGGQAQVGK